MSLIRVSADNPAALLAAAVLLLVLGLAGIASLPIQMLPNLEYPEININTAWRNAAPQEVEASIVEPQEDALRQVPGVVEMSSDVRSGNGNVHLRFDVGTDLQQAMLDVLFEYPIGSDTADFAIDPAFESIAMCLLDGRRYDTAR